MGLLEMNNAGHQTICTSNIGSSMVLEASGACGVESGMYVRAYFDDLGSGQLLEDTMKN